MIYADTDFFLALLKDSDWLKTPALKLLDEHRGKLWTSPATMIELLLLAAEFNLDPHRLLVDALSLAELKGGEADVFLAAAAYMQEHQSGVFDSLHAAYCGTGSKIISSDRVFDKLGLERIGLGSNAEAA